MPLAVAAPVISGFHSRPSHFVSHFFARLVPAALFIVCAFLASLVVRVNIDMLGMGWKLDFEIIPGSFFRF